MAYIDGLSLSYDVVSILLCSHLLIFEEVNLDLAFYPVVIVGACDSNAAVDNYDLAIDKTCTVRTEPKHFSSNVLWLL